MQYWVILMIPAQEYHGTLCYHKNYFSLFPQRSCFGYDMNNNGAAGSATAAAAIGKGLHEMSARHRIIFFFSFVLFATLLIAAGPVFTEQFDGRGYFIKGRQELVSGRYEDAVRSLQVAEEEFPLLGDYAAFSIVEAYHRAGDHGKALKTVRSLLKTYPQSPLTRKARSAEIREAKETGDKDLPNLYEAYARDYPEDGEITMAYARYLKGHGEETRAVPLFRAVYVRGGASSAAALAELGPDRVTAQDLLDRAGHFMNRYEFVDAEKELRKALRLDDGKRHGDILKGLGDALFRQKNYKEAASVYEKVHDLYSRTRALYRAGDKEGFEKSLALLLEKKDRRAGDLLLVSASDRRRAGDFEEALKLYDDVLQQFPQEEEDALWGIGWTLFLSGEHSKAADTFSKLAARYDDPKYRYWQARSIEALGEDAGELYASIAGVGNNFYAFMAQLKRKGRLIPASYAEPLAAPGPEGLQWRRRIEALLSVDMRKEASAELSGAAKNIENRSDLLYIIAKFYGLGDYRKAVVLATKMPYTENVYRLWYPLVYWDEVSSVTRKNDFDPMFALSVMREESRFDAEARSAAGACGLMQLMPQTAYRLSRSLHLGIRREAQIRDVRSNVTLGVQYLKSLFSEFHSMAHALAAYNAGEAAVRRWEAEGHYSAVDVFIEDIPYGETRNYVKKVLTSYFQYRKSSPPGPGDPLPGKL